MWTFHKVNRLFDSIIGDLKKIICWTKSQIENEGEKMELVGYVSIGEVHDVWCRTALPMCKADAVLKDHIGCVVFPQVCVDDQWADLIAETCLDQPPGQHHPPLHTSGRVPLSDP